MAASSGGSGAGRPDFLAVSIMKPVDSCSAVLGQALSLKKSIPEVTITTQLNGSLTTPFGDYSEECGGLDQFHIDSAERVCNRADYAELEPD
jgi:hypothetical protein